MKTRLFTPGPVEIPARILRALSQVPPHHRTDVFRATMKRVTEELRWVHCTEGEVFLLGASGTGGMEAAVVNLMSPRDKALVPTAGKFGDRWASILKAYAVPHQTIPFEWGSAIDPNAVRQALEQDPSITAVFTTHSETSTGVVHDLEAIARITRPKNVLLVVDGITSVGVHPLPQDRWGVDVVVCGSQKGLMIPPGIATVSLAPWAAKAIEGERLPRFYWDLIRARKSAPLGETAFTPPVSLVLALEESLAMLREEGLEAVHDRHRKLAHALAAGAQALGFTLFAARPGHAVTSLVPPGGGDASPYVKRLREAHGMVVAGGQDHLKGKIFRIGHMGAYDLGDIHAVLGALDECVTTLSGAAGKNSVAVRAMSAATAAWQEA
ncbi:MAG TPA: alanine--glyoxylate aminotransferase family protein [Dongiaceae bacterium]|nr:alanine--glyoxylate aminotransferase family protein [Dongiaceae bacterium]